MIPAPDVGSHHPTFNSTALPKSEEKKDYQTLFKPKKVVDAVSETSEEEEPVNNFLGTDKADHKLPVSLLGKNPLMSYPCKFGMWLMKYQYCILHVPGKILAIANTILCMLLEECST